MDWKRGEVASQGNHLCSWEVWGWWMGLGSPGPYGQVRGWMLLGGLGLGDGAGCSWARWAGAPRDRPEPCSPSIRKRCARGFPQGTAEPLRHASNETILGNCHLPRGGRERKEDRRVQATAAELFEVPVNRHAGSGPEALSETWLLRAGRL